MSSSRKQTVSVSLFFPLIWQWKKPLLLLLLLPAMSGIFLGGRVFFLKKLLDVISSFSQNMWDSLIPSFLGLVLSDCADNLGWRLREYLVIKTIPKLKGKIRETLLVHVQKQSYSYFQENFTGTLSNQVLDVAYRFEHIETSLAIICFIVAHVAISSILLYQIHVIFCLFLSIWFIIYMIFLAFWLRRNTLLSQQHAQKHNVLSGQVVDMIKNSMTVRVFAQGIFELERLRRKQKKEIQASEKVLHSILHINFFKWIMSLGLIVSIFFLFLHFWMKGMATTGDFVLSMQSSMTVIMFMYWIGEVLPMLSKEWGAVKEALQKLSVPHQIVDVSNSADLNVVKGKIIFDNVTFHYTPEQNLFRNKQLTIEPKETVGLVGFSGSGKTTFIHLLLRHFDLESGRILIDDQDIRCVSQDSLRRQISYIPQDTMLFHRTLRENIIYGNEETTEEEMVRASKLAYCHEFIVQLKEGYDSVVGEGGMKLSGGQRQRIAIARAILKKSPIFILDEATSALDSVTEKQIQNNLWKFVQERTTIIVAHRLSTLQNVDRILVFQEGSILEQGTHRELLAYKGHYAYLWHHQVNGLLPEKEL